MTEKKRYSGILLAISSLPSNYGIGTMGKAAYEFIDFLKKSGQTYWQILPVGPVSCGDSPYQSFSSFAGNPYYIDLDFLISDGLLKRKDVAAVNWGEKETLVDYAALYENRFEILKKAYNKGFTRDREKVEAFCAEKQSWIYDYALFMALKRHFDMKPWSKWPEDLRLRKPAALEKYREKLESEVNFFIYIQYLFYLQWSALKGYAGENGIKIIGDMPIYVAYDSADCWAEPNWFYLDEENVPVEVAGVPPDYFNENGQLWGNPLYRWDALRRDGYGWWIRRIGAAFELFDVVRLDHFRGFDSYWAVAFGEATAKKGRWVKGPGFDFVYAVKNWFYGKDFIAEDLGILTDDVRELLESSGFPGMKVMEFSLDEGNKDGLPYNFSYNTVCYSGTHDNSP
nr:4-alpha-glucanotransferase [Lachnospiraceae bacterium]